MFERHILVVEKKSSGMLGPVIKYWPIDEVGHHRPRRVALVLDPELVNVFGESLRLLKAAEGFLEMFDEGEDPVAPLLDLRRAVARAKGEA